MIPNSISLAQAGQLPPGGGGISAATVRIVPTVTATEPATIPGPRPSSAAAYFGMFRSCDCGHSSAWHSGAFGEAWRAGEQVRGRCEASVEDGAAAACSCARFRETNVAS